MKISETDLSQVFIIENYFAKDIRGSFIKLFNQDEFKKYGLETDFKETYYSISNRNVIRGLHFQTPPYDHNKIVHVINGSVLDVVVDLRKKSKTYGNYYTFELNSSNKYSLYIPKGFAHGFKSLEDNTMMLYEVSTVFNAQAEGGIRWDSIGYTWSVDNPILSDRDKSFVSLQNFISPF